MEATKEIQWTFSDAEKTGKYIGIIEFQSIDKEWHNFEIYDTKDKIVFGGFCNTGFIESGYLPKDNDFSFDENLSELLADLECYYDNNKEYICNIVTNERM